MGVYVNTMRAKTRQIDLQGKKVKANIFLYLCRLSSLDTPILATSREERRARLYQNHVDKAGDLTPASGVAILAYKDGTIHYDGAEVITNLKSNVWYDCDRLPGDLAGWIHVEGKKLVVKTHTKWSPYGKRQRRLVLKDGKAVEEFRECPLTTHAKSAIL